MGVLVLLEARVATGLELEVAKLEPRREVLPFGQRMASDSSEPHPPLLARLLPIGAGLDAVPAEGRFVERDAGSRHPLCACPRFACTQQAIAQIGLQLGRGVKRPRIR